MTIRNLAQNGILLASASESDIKSNALKLSHRPTLKQKDIFKPVSSTKHKLKTDVIRINGHRHGQTSIAFTE